MADKSNFHTVLTGHKYREDSRESRPFDRVYKHPSGHEAVVSLTRGTVHHSSGKTFTDPGSLHEHLVKTHGGGQMADKPSGESKPQAKLPTSPKATPKTGPDENKVSQPSPLTVTGQQPKSRGARCEAFTGSPVVAGGALQPGQKPIQVKARQRSGDFVDVAKPPGVPKAPSVAPKKNPMDVPPTRVGAKLGLWDYTKRVVSAAVGPASVQSGGHHEALKGAGWQYKGRDFQGVHSYSHPSGATATHYQGETKIRRPGSAPMSIKGAGAAVGSQIKKATVSGQAPGIEKKVASTPKPAPYSGGHTVIPGPWVGGRKGQAGGFTKPPGQKATPKKAAMGDKLPRVLDKEPWGNKKKDKAVERPPLSTGKGMTIDQRRRKSEEKWAKKILGPKG